MLKNEFMKSKELRNRKLVDLYEEGIINIGDEIPYEHSEKTYLSPLKKNGFRDQTFSTKGIELKWQAIGVEQMSGERCLKLIAKDPVFKFIMGGARGFVNGAEELNKISQLFMREEISLEGRSLTIEDVNQLLDVEVNKAERRVYQKGYFSDDINKNKCFMQLCEPLHKEKYYDPESFLEKKYSTKEIMSTAYTYEPTSLKGREKEKEIIFSRGHEYWLASPGIKGDTAIGFGFSYVCRFGIYLHELFDSFGLESHPKYYIRPIIYLKPNMTPNNLIGFFYEKEKEKIEKELRKIQQEIRQKEKELQQELKKISQQE